ncbi:MAG: radical SAM protein [Spirochaetales bacterium]|nr:radical SAM protein [Spirochaetales bacterium]
MSNESIIIDKTKCICPVCRKVLDADIIEEDNKIFYYRVCPEHGECKSLAYSDAAWYKKYIENNDSPILKNKNPNKKRTLGCPDDCGMCDEHKQQMTVYGFELTNYCDQRCPVCFATPDDSWFIPYEKIVSMVNKAVGVKGSHLEYVDVSGGEPTLHRDFFKIMDYMFEKGGARRIIINTNGIRLGNDDDFARTFAGYGTRLLALYGFESFKEEPYLELRGRKFLKTKMKILEQLEKYNVQTLLSTIVAKGVNDEELGELIKFAMDKKFIRGNYLLPLRHMAKKSKDNNKKWVPFEKEDLNQYQDRTTQPDVIKAICKNVYGLLSEDDFLPVPSSHPGCHQTAYLVTLPNGLSFPLNKLIKNENLLICLKNHLVVDMDKVNAFIDELNIKEKYPGMAGTEVSEDNVLQILIHSTQDPFTWDLKRLQYCTHHYMHIDERLFPCCNYYNIYQKEYREKDKETAKKYSYTLNELNAIKK